MKLPIDFKNGASVLNKLKANYSILLWFFLGIIILLTALVMFKELNKVFEARPDTAGILDKIVRVNLGRHAAIEKQLGENSSFQPHPVPGADAFGAAPVNKGR